jgi:hypothetical protein
MHITENKIFNINNAILYISIGIILRLCYFYFLSPHFLYNGSWITIKGDSNDYLNLAENLYNKSTYSMDRYGEIEHAFRMPGITPFYLFFRLFMEKESSIFCVLIFQTILSGAAIYYLSKISYIFSKSPLAFFFTFILFSISTHLPKYNNLFLNESLASSFLIFGAYQFVTFLNSKKKKNIFLCGCFLGWLVFLRPFSILLLPFVAILIFINSHKKNINLGLFFIFPILTLITWNVRNYNYNGKVVLLENSGNWLADYPNAFIDIYDIVKGTGGDLIEWEQNSDINWFFSDKFLHDNFKIKRSLDSILPPILFTDELTIELLKEGQVHFSIALDSSTFLSKEIIAFHDKKAVEIFQKFSNNLKENHPFTYHVKSRFRYLNRFLDQNIGASVRSFKYPFNVGFTFIDAFINFICITIGFTCFLIGFIINIKSLKHWFIYGLAAYSLLIFPFVLKTSEQRFLILSFPFLIISLVIIFQSKYLNRKTTITVIAAIVSLATIAAYYTTKNFIIW